MGEVVGGWARRESEVGVAVAKDAKKAVGGSSRGLMMLGAAKGDTVMATSTRLFQGRVVADSAEKKGESLLASTPVVVLSTILGRTPTKEEYAAAVTGIKLTSYAPPAA